MKDFLDILEDNQGLLVVLELKSGERMEVIPKRWAEVDDGLAFAVKVKKGTERHPAGMGFIFHNEEIASINPIQA